MKVWILSYDPPYESGFPSAVFASEEAGVAALIAHGDDYHRLDEMQVCEAFVPCAHVWITDTVHWPSYGPTLACEKCHETKNDYDARIRVSEKVKARYLQQTTVLT